MITVVTQPIEEPITLDEAKLHLRVDVDVDDTLINAQITAARLWCEQFTGRAFVTQTIELALDAWPTGNYDLWRLPVQGVTSVTYTDEDGSAAVMDTADYEVDTRQGRIKFVTLPSVTLQSMSGIVIKYVVGYGLAVDVPETIRQAAKLLVGDMYLFRESSISGTIITNVPFSVEALLWPSRTWRRYA